MFNLNGLVLCAVGVGLILFGELSHDLDSLSEIHGRVSQGVGLSILAVFVPVIYLSIVPDHSANTSSSSSNGTSKWGGQRLLFQILSWGIFLLSCALSLSLALWWRYVCEKAWGLIPSITSLVLLSVVFLVSSIASEDIAITSAINYMRVNAFFGINVVLAIAAAVLGVLAEINWKNRGNSRVALVEAILSISFAITALFNTHGLGGQLANKNWSFWNPFVGGIKFVLLQFISWLLFSVSVIISIAFIVSFYTVGLELFVGVTAISGVFCLAAELLMILSLYAYEDTASVLKTSSVTSAVDTADATSSTNVKKENWIHAWVRDMHAFLITTLMVNIQYVSYMSIYPLFLIFGLSTSHAALHWWCAAVSTSLFTIVYLFFKTTDSKLQTQSSLYLMTRSVCLTIVIYIPLIISVVVYFMFHSVETIVPWSIISLVHISYTTFSYNDNPELTGCRELSPNDLLWPWLRSIDEHVQLFFNGKVFKEVDLLEDKLYIFGYHPHGVLPVSLFWLRNSDDWSSLFPGVVFSVLTASSLHLVPVMRDLLQWKGGREVSLKSFDYSLSRKRNVLVVPGGQTELMLSRSNQTQIKLAIKHQGFIRIAIERGVDLVPVFSFGENDVLDNIQLPVLQNWFLKRLGAALPFHPHSGWLLPVPRKQNVTVVVGAPIQVKQITKPNASDIKAVLDLYLTELHRIFEKHKNSNYSLQDRQLLFIDGNNSIYDLPHA